MIFKSNKQDKTFSVKLSIFLFRFYNACLKKQRFSDRHYSLESTIFDIC
ncbi:hypothetical protein HMPREF9370_1221 [Neisseria wadsworthii 9715]|uniref:Uncharacterized protein n=1 Tax=Neisseria wadsworthii 9715 TaxID=1030841 RepID=G4CQ61_9NEIS|nr:hypothetical protein HMPREF9370_1221 [Neisseria wadsworthii 9715]